MLRAVFDLESDGFLDKLTKLHCLCYTDYDTGLHYVLTEYSDIIAFFIQEDLTLIGHNICRFDIPAAQKVLGIQINARLIDTLPLSWYLNPQRLIHGLEEWGVYYGVPKPVITDWENQTLAEYCYRCSEDVKINTNLFTDQLNYLREIYSNDFAQINRLIDYLTFKMKCAAEQEAVKWRLDIDKCQEFLAQLLGESETRTELLADAMPRVVKYKVCKPPAKPLKADGSISSHGQKWLDNLAIAGLPAEHDEEFKIPTGETDRGNPGSFVQLKNWLFGLGWEPETFKFVVDKDKITKVVKGERSVPQLGTDGILCSSVKVLMEQEPELIHLEGLFIINHRITILNGFLENVDEQGYLQAEIAGLTNTLRFKHKTIVNLPTVTKPYGDMMRGVLICDEGYTLCGSDMSSLEDNTKQHYMFYYDPDYVAEMRAGDFDPHISIGLKAELITPEEAQFFKWMDGKADVSTVSIRYTSMSEEEQKAEFKRIGAQRKVSKIVNFSAVYGAGPPKIAKSGKMALKLSKLLHKAYWEKNWSVKKIAADCHVIQVRGQLWLYNPVSKFYYSLRAEKDRFSTLNQGTGVFCFDKYVLHVRCRGIRICGQFHDEIAFPLPIGMEEQIRIMLKECITAVNEELKLNIQLGISVDFGPSYASIH